MNVALLSLSCLMSLAAPVSGTVLGPTGTMLAPPPVRVRLAISAREERMSQIRGAMVAELLSRGPVQLVEQDPEWTIQIVTTELADANGVTAAVGLSFVIEQHGVHMKMLDAMAQACRYFMATGLLHDAPLESEMRQLLRGAELLPKPASLGIVSQHKMCLTTPDRLAQVCRDIVTIFNNDRLGITAAPVAAVPVAAAPAAASPVAAAPAVAPMAGPASAGETFQMIQ
jgi:hypothetical protein